MSNDPRGCEGPEHIAYRDGNERDVRYSNHFQIGHNAFEFVLDFGQMFSDGEKERLHTRIVTSPMRAKELLQLLDRAVGQYEESFGDIRTDEAGLEPR